MMKNFLTALLLCTFLGVACAKKDNAKPDETNKPPVDTPEPPASVADCKMCIILAEQKEQRVAIADVDSKTIIWEWNSTMGVNPQDQKWFTNISDAKLVYNKKYILTTASGGGVALIRIADKKVVFYAYAGGNTHSAEILPDGNIVSASSTDNYLKIFKVDTLHFPANVYSKKITLEFAHNVVWDRAEQLLWSAAMNKLNAYRYNFDCQNPDLTLVQSIDLPGTEAHDLFPVYGENALWLTNTSHVFKFDIAAKKLTQADDVLQSNIKSVSSGPDGFPVIIIHPKESWWTDEVWDSKGKSVFYQYGLKIYKARWFLPNTFSYPENDVIRQCE